MYVLMFIFSFLISTQCLGSIYLDVHTSVGNGQAVVENESDSPSMLQYGIGTTIGLGFYPFILGVSADKYLVNQMSDVKSPYGNRKGSRTNIFSLTIGLNIMSFILKADYQFMGNYNLDKKNIEGLEIKYETPKGLRFYLGMQFEFMPLAGKLGFFYESVDYEKEIVGANESILSNKMNIKQIGLMAQFDFDFGLGI